MGRECFLPFTTSHLSVAQQDLAKYKLRLVNPPELELPLGKKANVGKIGPDIEPNLWMWVNPNVVYPPGKLEVAGPQKEYVPSMFLQSPKQEDESSYSEALEGQLLLPSSEQLPPQKQQQQRKRKRSAASPRSQELTEEEEAKDQDDSSVALPSPPTRAPLQNRRLQQAISPEGRLWSRPPLNYFHLIALALRNSPPCGLNVQQIYSFTRQHFPFFRTAPEGWKNTVRHNLCFRDSFEKVPVSMQGEASTRPSRSCLWKLTEEGRRRFAEDARALASARLESIQQCMSQPDVMPFLFDLNA